MLQKWLLSSVFVLLALVGWCQDAGRKIQSMDKLKLSCAEESLLSKTYKVTKDGVILVDFLGAVDVAGLTEQEAASKISSKLTADRILKKATVTVAVVGAPTPSVPDQPKTSPEQPKTNPTLPELPKASGAVKLSGAVKAAGDVEFRDGLKLSEVLKLGATTDTADSAHVTVKSSDGSVRMIDTTRPGEDLLLKVGDEVLVPELKKESPVRNEVYVMGGVAKPGSVLLSGSMTMKSVIEAAGGFTSLAAKKKVRLEREGQAPQTYDLTTSNTDVNLLPNDKVVVEVSESRAYIQIDGAVRNPGYFVAQPGMKLSEALAAAGGAFPQAKMSKIKITSSSGGKGREVNFEEIQQGYSGDVVLQPGDVVSVPGAKKKGGFPIKLALGATAAWLLLHR